MSKIMIRYGTISVEFEGTEEFIRKGLLDLLGKISELQPPPNGAIEPKTSRERKESETNYSVKTIYAKLGYSKGPDLARAAAAFLTLVQNRETFGRADLLKAMQTATGIYKTSTHSANLGKILDGLIDSRELMQNAGGQYSLAEDQRIQINARLTNV